MIYLITVLSLAGNGILIWYIRKLLQKYWFDVEVREKFTQMLSDYEEALKSMHKLEEFYGEEIIKKAIIQTNFVIEACKEFRESIDTQVKNSEEELEEIEYEDKEIGPPQAEKAIRIREGEKVTQDADKYRRVVIDDN